MGTSEAAQTALLERVRQGDDAAITDLLEAVQPQLYRFSLTMCRHPEDAEDVLQDTMLAVARSARGFRGASSLSTWLYTVARSFCIKNRRKSRHAPGVQASLHELDPSERAALASDEDGPHARLEQAEVWQRVQAGIRELEPTYKEVVVLRDVEGLAASEVAEVIGISVAAVKSRLHRGRNQLRELLAPEFGPGTRCPDIRLIFSQFLEGELPRDVCVRMESHVEVCAACARECKGLREVLNACSTAPAEVPPGVQARVQAALKAALAGIPDATR